MPFATIKPPPAPEGQPQPHFLRDLFSLVHDMSAVQRFSRIRMVHPENVLQHTGMVCVFAYAIANQLIRKAPRELKPLDIGLVMCRAAVHDMDETKTGDVVRPTKYFSEALRGELRKLEAVGVNDIACALGLHRITADWMKAKQGREGFIVRLADFLAALCTVYIEVRVCNNVAMKQPAATMRALAIDMFGFAAAAGFDDAEIKELDLILHEAKRLLERCLSAAPFHDPLPSIHGDA